MHKNFKENVTRYWKSLDRISGYTVPNETIFRLLVNKKFNYKNKNILDIGIGNGDNLLEFKRRGADIFGVDIRGKIINSFCKINKLPKKNFFTLDLNYEFPIIQKKLDLINCKDIIYYIDLEKQFDFIMNCKNI